MNIYALDLNLLVALEALLSERHVTRAAQRIGLSQSGMSNALGRLREHFADPLLVRQGKRMVPSPRALALHEPLREALSRLETEVLSPVAFEPGSSERRFMLAGDDYTSSVFVSAMLRRTRRNAPGITLHVAPHHQQLPVEALQHGRLDAALGVFWDAPGSLQRDVLVQERFACVLPRGLLAPNQTLTLKSYLDLPHVLVSSSGATRGILDELLAARGRRRHIAATVPAFHALPALLQALGAVATVPSRLAKSLGPRLVQRKPPLPTPSWPVCLVWDRRFDADPGHSWLRASLREAS